MHPIKNAELARHTIAAQHATYGDVLLKTRRSLRRLVEAGRPMVGEPTEAQREEYAFALAEALKLVEDAHD